MEINQSTDVTIREFPIDRINNITVSNDEIQINTNNKNGTCSIRIYDKYNSEGNDQPLIVVLNAVTKYLTEDRMYTYSVYGEPKTLMDAKQALIEAVLKMDADEQRAEAQKVEDSEPF